jgi:hypothetical protein
VRALVYDIIIFILGTLGLIWIIKEIVIPLGDGLLYAVGATIFDMWRIDWSKAWKMPLPVTIFILKYFFNNFLDRFDWGEITERRSGRKRWKPYFHYWTVGSKGASK